VSQVFCEMALDISINCSATKCQKGHLSSFEVLMLAIKLVDHQKGKSMSGESEWVLVRGFDSLSIKQEQVAACGECYLCRGCFLRWLRVTVASL